jgi:hypothetical protein
MSSNSNNYYIFIEEQNKKSVIKLVYDFNWNILPISGYFIENLKKYPNEYDIDDIMKDLINKYDYVEEVSFEDIDDYIS